MCRALCRLSTPCAHESCTAQTSKQAYCSEAVCYVQLDTVAGQIRLDQGLKEALGGNHADISLRELCTRMAPQLLPLEPHTFSYTVRCALRAVCTLLQGHQCADSTLMCILQAACPGFQIPAHAGWL